MIYILGDTHIRKEEPYYSAVNNVFKEIYEECNEGDTIIQLGDFFHTYKPFPKEYSLAFYWIEKLSSKNVKLYIMAGNNAHEYHHLQKTYAIDPLDSFDNVILIKDIEKLTVENISFLVLPWIPESRVKSLKLEDVCVMLKNYINNLESSDIDYFLYHYEDETVFMGGENRGIDFSFVESMIPGIKRIGGHIHLQSDNYLGTPFQTRFDELGQVGRYYTVEDNYLKSHELKNYVKHLKIDFDSDCPKLEFKEQKIVVNISDAPSVDSVYEKFKDRHIFINDIKLRFSENRTETLAEGMDSESSIKELLNEYITINNVDRKTSSYLLNLF
jgi:DNA repair exonuclease SbcCD nuclease subunit